MMLKWCRYLLKLKYPVKMLEGHRQECKIRNVFFFNFNWDTAIFIVYEKFIRIHLNEYNPIEHLATREGSSNLSPVSSLDAPINAGRCGNASKKKRLLDYN